MASDAVVNLVVNAADAERDVLTQLRRIVDDAERRNVIDLTVNIDQTSVVSALNRLDTTVDDRFRDLTDSLADHFSDLADRIGSSMDESNDHLRSLSSTLSDLTDRMNEVGDAGDDAFGDLADGSRRAGFEVETLDADFGRLTSVLSSAGSLMTRFTIASGAIGGIIPLAAGLVASLTNLAPAAAAGVTAFVAMKAATATLKLGLVGVSDAITAVFDPEADPAKVAEALEQLSTNARSFVLQLQELRPAFDNLRIDVQDRLFRGLDSTLEQTARTVFPELRTAAQDFADTFNFMARDTGKQAQQLSREGTLGKALDSSTEAFQNLRDIPGQVLLSIGRLSAGGGPLLERVTERVSELADALTTKLEEASKSGALEEAVNNAGDALAQLGRIVGNIVGGIGNIFGAVELQGDGLFGTLERLTQAFEDLTASEEFQTILSAILSLGETLVTNILPLLEEAFRALAPAIDDLAPILEDIVNSLGDELAKIIPELAPILLELVIAFGELWRAVEPLLPVLGELIRELLPELVPLIRDSARLLSDMAPIIAFVAEGFSMFLIPLLRELTGMFVTFNGVMVDVVDWLTDVGGAVLELANRALHDILIPALRTVIDLLRGDFSGAWKNAQNVIDGFRDTSTGSVRSTVTSWIRSITDAGATIVTNTRNSFSRMVSAVREHLGDAAANLRAFPGRALAAFAGFNNLLYSAGRALIQGFISGIRSQLNAVVDAARDIVGAARDYFPFSPAKRGPFSGTGYTRYSGRKLIEDFAKGIRDQRKDVSRALLDSLASPLLAGSTVSGNTTLEPGGGSFAGLTLGAFSRTAPSVAVFIGDEQITDRVRIVVDDQLDSRDRLVGQGVRV